MNARTAPLSSNILKNIKIKESISINKKEVRIIPVIVCRDSLWPILLPNNKAIGNSKILKTYAIPKTFLKYMYEPIFSESESGSIEPSTNKGNAIKIQKMPKYSTIQLIIEISKKKEAIINTPNNNTNPIAIISCSLPFTILEDNADLYNF